MDLQTLAAVLGVGVAFGAAVVAGAWRWWTWRQEHKTLVTVKIAMGFLTFGPKLVEAVILTVFNRSGHPVRVTGVGLSGHPVRVTGVGLEANDGSKRQLVQIIPQPGAGVPGTIAPRDSAQTWFERADIDNRGGIDVYRPVRGQVVLAERDRPIWSRRRALMRKD